MIAASDYKYLYRTARWKALSTQWRINHPHCVFCHGPAEVVDHKQPHRGNERLFFSLSNLQSLCYRCHNSIKARMENGKQVVINNQADNDGLPVSDDHPWNK